METTPTITTAAGLADQDARIKVLRLIDDMLVREAVRRDSPWTFAPAVPRAVNHQIDGCDFELYPDGTLSIARSGEPLVDVSPRHAFALLQFMRMPGVAALIEAVDSARQTRIQLEYEATLAEEAAAGR